MKNFALKILDENTNEWVYIAPQNFCPLAAGKGNFALPVDRPNGHFYDVVPLVDRPVDRDWIQRAAALCRSTRAISREQKLSGDRPTRSTGLQPRLRARSVHVGRPTSASADRSGRPADSQVNIFRD